MANANITRDEAYDRIDRILRLNLDDINYATFSGLLDVVYGVSSGNEELNATHFVVDGQHTQVGRPDEWRDCPHVDGALCASKDECAGGCVRNRK